MSEVVLDASAVLALLREEPGARVVESHLNRAIMSTVNYCEVIAQLIKYGMPEKLALTTVNSLGLHLVVFNEELAYQTAALIKITSGAGLSLGDRACLALAHSLKKPAITADKHWAKLNIDIELKLIR